MENRFKTADEYVCNLNNRPNLYSECWQSNSTALICASDKNDRTALALNIILQLATDNQKVFYLTTQSFSKPNIQKIKHSKNIYVHTPEYINSDDTTDYADLALKDLEEAIATTGATILVVDSVTRIAAKSFGKNSSAAFVMKRLVALQMRHKISLLVLADETTKSAKRSLTTLADCVIEMPEPENSTVEPIAKQIGEQIPRTEQKVSPLRASGNKNIIQQVLENPDGFVAIHPDGRMESSREWLKSQYNITEL